MKTKTIKAILKCKFSDWVKSIDDGKTASLVKQNTIITGGCIASMLLGSKVSDFDIYFRDKETVLAIANYYVKKFSEVGNQGPQKPGQNEQYPIEVIDEHDRVRIRIPSAGIAGINNQGYKFFEADPDPDSLAASEYVDKAMGVAEAAEAEPPYRPVFFSSNAISLSGNIQLVIRFFGEPDEIHKNYDFVHCTNWWDSKTEHLELKKEAMESLLTKELKYVGSKYPICSMIRTRKFIKRGWTINAGQMLKIALQISDLDLDNPEILREQLVGVDVAYFTELISLLRKKKADGKSVDRAYVVEIIERIF